MVPLAHPCVFKLNALKAIQSIGGAHDIKLPESVIFKLNGYFPLSNFALMNLYYFNIGKNISNLKIRFSLLSPEI